MENAAVVLAIILAPWIAASITALASRSRVSRDRIGRLAAALVACGFAAAVALTPLVVGSAPPSLGFGVTVLRVDGLALILSIVVLGLSALIQSFAIRYLRGDTRQLWFIITSNLLTGATLLMVCAGSVAVFAVAWISAGGALILLLATYRPLEQARVGVRRTSARFLIADSAFLVGVSALVIFAGGDISLNELGVVATSMPLPMQWGVALLLVAAALARSSQIPFQNWLPFTLAAPTPVSALMHAGIVNAGAILIVRFAPAIAPHQFVMIVIFLAGAATLLFASTVRLVRPDVKGRLVFSTMAQMGFMIMTCGLGLFAAAIFHLVAHSLFKSALFLGAGMGVRQNAVNRDLPSPKLSSRSRVLAIVALAIIVPATSLAGAKLIFAPDSTAASVGLLAFVAVTASVAVGSALMANFTARTITASIAATAVVSVGYVAFLRAFSTVLEPTSTVSAAPAWLLVLPALGLLLLQFLAGEHRIFGSLRDVVYTRSVASTIDAPSTVKGIRT